MEKENTKVTISGCIINITLDDEKIKKFALQMAHDAALKYIEENGLSEKYKLLEEKEEYKHITYFNIYGANLNFRLQDLSLDNEKPQRELMFKKAAEIKLSDILEEFRKTANESNRRSIAQFCNTFSSDRDYSLKDIISRGKDDVLKFNRIGIKALDLFEKFINAKDFEFAKWNGKEWV
jgi:hypothetical protein